MSPDHKGEYHWTSETQGQHRGADVTREEMGLNPRIYRHSGKVGWIQHQCGCGNCAATWVLLQHMTGSTSFFWGSHILPSSHGKPNLGLSLKSLCKAGPGSLCSCKSRKEVWTQSVKCSLCHGYEVCPLCWDGVKTLWIQKRKWKRGAYMWDFPEEKDPDNLCCPQRELLADKHH